ncbi:uncharacterized protein EV422DRAFT_514993 [Fimicolochytrium jonesii]|uniref:uncharacterized protein n=1 Tax=Fimicolochytrium jonesii TaxID=1396493 RepID=UPI0022FDE4BA|nr:uncharacterized protein EV422DRAFT_514993 [Fimicolochytrium jonesii]KAI8826007.1 hypothetical protein EV422DRAFT_514993 [Fimicolochytrium jonesii]
MSDQKRAIGVLSPTLLLLAFLVLCVASIAGAAPLANDTLDSCQILTNQCQVKAAASTANKKCLQNLKTTCSDAVQTSSGFCFTCQCDTLQVMDSLKCGGLKAYINKAQALQATTTRKLSPKPTSIPKRPKPNNSNDGKDGKPNGDKSNDSGIIVPSPSEDPSSQSAGVPDFSKAKLIGGGVGGTIACLLIVAGATTLVVTQRRRKAGTAGRFLGARKPYDREPGCTQSPRSAVSSTPPMLSEIHFVEENSKRNSKVSNVFNHKRRSSRIEDASVVHAEQEPHKKVDVDPEMAQVRPSPSPGHSALSGSLRPDTGPTMPHLAIFARPDAPVRTAIPAISSNAASPSPAPVVPPIVPLKPTPPVQSMSKFSLLDSLNGIRQGSETAASATSPVRSLISNPFSRVRTDSFADAQGPPPLVLAPAAESLRNDPLYMQHLREREEMRRHWQKLQGPAASTSSTSDATGNAAAEPSTAPRPTAAAVASLAVAGTESPSTGYPHQVLKPSRIPFSCVPNKPFIPSPLRQATTSSQSTLASTSSMMTTSSQGLNTHTALSSYVPQRDDEIAVHCGDTVAVWRVWEDGWCKGAVLTGGDDDDLPGSEYSSEDEDDTMDVSSNPTSKRSPTPTASSVSNSTTSTSITTTSTRSQVKLRKHRQIVAEGVFPVRCLRVRQDAYQSEDGDVGTLCGWEGERADSLESEDV